MRKNWKKLVSLVLTAACTMVVTVAPVFADAASTPAYSPVEASTVDSLLSSSAQWVGQSLMTYSDDDLANMEASDQQFYARAAEAWEEAKADLGEVKSLEDGTLEVDGDFVTCTIPGEFEKNPGIVRVFWNISTGTPVPTDLTITVEESKGVLIGQPGMNTIIGIGTVFVMLIFKSFGTKNHTLELRNKHCRVDKILGNFYFPRSTPISETPAVFFFTNDKAVLCAALHIFNKFFHRREQRFKLVSMTVMTIELIRNVDYRSSPAGRSAAATGKGRGVLNMTCRFVLTVLYIGYPFSVEFLCVKFRHYGVAG